MKIFKAFLKASAIALIALVLIFLAMTARNYIRLQRGDLIKWNNEFYTKEELAEVFPPQVCLVEAKNNQEEVYAVFRQALLDDNIDLALEQISEESRDKYKEAFQYKEKLDNWVSKLPENITKEDEYGNFSYYDLDMGTEYKNTISFSKDCFGYWKIDSI